MRTVRKLEGVPTEVRYLWPVQGGGHLFAVPAAEGAEGVLRVQLAEDDGSTVVSLGAYVEARDAEKPLGVYAVYDAQKSVQYVGYSRNVVVALKTHTKRLGTEKCAFTRVMVFANKVCML